MQIDKIVKKLLKRSKAVDIMDFTGNRTESKGLRKEVGNWTL
jgi:hypothetical protein